ncbi:MAG: SDR family NAD(P)-dependent oxidoreductase [Dehalococcoidia bacterium]|nr:SDR family NAD(P)-dependent oxidoreductase [Chloroflexota bacterium]MCZ6866488.1 SDR family NAD(P)-dependent oxidoreductase [Chloroflexota bacterium]
MEIEFTGKTAIVTGAAHGIGRAIVHGLAARGARVWACDILGDELQETVATTEPQRGGNVHSSITDVSDPKAVTNLVSQASAETGRVDILVHSAGGTIGQVGQPVEEVTEEQWQSIFDVNLKGAFICSQAVVPGMKEAGSGRILIISSGAGLGVSLTGIQAYASAKAGQIGFVRQLAHELGSFGITVNSVAPGFVRSNPASERQWGAMGAEGQERLVQSIAMKRLGRPDDIANAVMFLVSDYASYIAGQTLSVNGGR